MKEFFKIVENDSKLFSLIVSMGCFSLIGIISLLVWLFS